MATSHGFFLARLGLRFGLALAALRDRQTFSKNRFKAFGWQSLVKLGFPRGRFLRQVSLC